MNRPIKFRAWEDIGDTVEIIGDIYEDSDLLV